jgi:hypothetical protein
MTSVIKLRLKLVIVPNVNRPIESSWGQNEAAVSFAFKITYIYIYIYIYWTQVFKYCSWTIRPGG